MVALPFYRAPSRGADEGHADEARNPDGGRPSPCPGIPSAGMTRIRFDGFFSAATRDAPRHCRKTSAFILPSQASPVIARRRDATSSLLRAARDDDRPTFPFCCPLNYIP